MGQIGRFIDRCVAREPELMRRVLDRPWGTLAGWFDFDEEGEVCGCLVGSTLLAAGAVDARCRYATRDDMFAEEAWDAIGIRRFPKWADACRAGMQAANLGERLGDLAAIAFIKNRIARRLRERGIEMRRPEVRRVGRRETAGA